MLLESFSSASKSQLRTSAHVLPELSITSLQSSVSHASRCLGTRQSHPCYITGASLCPLSPYTKRYGLCFTSSVSLPSGVSAMGLVLCSSTWVSGRVHLLYQKLGCPIYWAGGITESSKQWLCFQDSESSFLPSSTLSFATNHSQPPFSSPNHTTLSLWWCLAHPVFIPYLCFIAVL